MFISFIKCQHFMVYFTDSPICVLTATSSGPIFNANPGPLSNHSFTAGLLIQKKVIPGRLIGTDMWKTEENNVCDQRRKCKENIMRS